MWLDFLQTQACTSNDSQISTGLNNPVFEVALEMGRSRIASCLRLLTGEIVGSFLSSLSSQFS